MRDTHLALVVLPRSVTFWPATMVEADVSLTTRTLAVDQ